VKADGVSRPRHRLSDGYRRDHPYKTRIVVRRPADAKRFNGTVLVEWDNVTNGFDAEKVWFFSWEQMVRAGYRQTYRLSGLGLRKPNVHCATSASAVFATSREFTKISPRVLFCAGVTKGVNCGTVNP
jgi:hypothetical protein